MQMLQFQVIRKLETLWERWRLEEVLVEGFDGLFQLRDVEANAVMRDGANLALFTSPRMASYAAFLGRARFPNYYKDSPLRSCY
jgi:hypothetical protein